MVFVTRMVKPMSFGDGVETVNIQITPRGPATVYFINGDLEYKSEFLIGSTTISVLKNSIFGSNAGMSGETGGCTILATSGTSSGGSAASFAVSQSDGSIILE